jgi:hypothetical protein
MPNPVIGVVAAAAGKAALDSNAANKQEKAQRNAANQSTALQQQQFDYVKNILAPYQETGQQALPALQSYINQPQQNFSFDYGAYFNSPEYAAQRGQAELAAMRNASATGGLRGGDAQVALASIAPQLAQQARLNAQGEFSLDQGANLNRYNMLQGIAGLGTGATSQLGNAAQNFGQAAGNNALRIGGYGAQRYAQRGEAQSGFLSDLTSIFGGFGGGGLGGGKF